MRITPEILWKVTRDTVAQRTKADRDIMAAYVQGSLLRESPLLGGTTDIDLVFVHTEASDLPREIIRMTDDVTLDIFHYNRSIYRQARQLRADPWMGTSIYSCKILFDPHHFMDFTQASVRGQFNQPDNVLIRSRGLAEKSRQTWLFLQDQVQEPTIGDTLSYLGVLEMAANSLSSLSGAPLTLRRFLLDFSERASAVSRPALANGLLGLLGAPKVEASQITAWMPSWKDAYLAIPAGMAPAELIPLRLNYYHHAIAAILESQNPKAALWPLICTWTQAASLLPAEAPEKAAWAEAAVQLGLQGPAFREHLSGLDAFLDTVEEILDEWARNNGV